MKKSKQVNPLFSIYPNDEKNGFKPATIHFGIRKWIVAVNSINDFQVCHTNGFSHFFIGDLNSQKIGFQYRAFNMLLYEDWDFHEFPNPDLVLFTELNVG